VLRRIDAGAGLASLVVALALLIAPTPASAATNLTYYAVPTGGAGTGCTATSPCTLDQAITNASSDTGDAVTIDLAAGDYPGPVTIAAGGELSLALTGAASLTAIDGGGTHQGLVVTAQSTTLLTIENLTLENGAAGPGENLEDDGSGAVTVVDDLFSGGSGTSGDGSIAVTTGALEITASTITGSTGAPGVLDMSGATTQIYGSTIAGNDGGVEVDNATGVTKLGADLLAANTTDCEDTSGAIDNEDYNYADDATCPGSNQASRASLGLGDLANNGGATQTLRITGSSSAYDVVPASAALAGQSTPFCSAGDQRGVPRTEGPAAACSAGAYQYSPPAITGLGPRASLELGLPVTLSGYGFGDVTSATFAGTAATIAAQSNTSITLDVPLSLSFGSQLITLTNPDGSAAVSFDAVASPTIAGATLAPGELRVAYSQAIAISGGAGPFSFTQTSGALPVGLTLSSAGVVSGTPTKAGGTAFAVEVTDANGFTSPSLNLSLDIATPIVTLETAKIKLTGAVAPVKVACAGAPCAGTVSLTTSVQTKVRGRLETTTVVLASGAYTLSPAQSLPIEIALTPQGTHTLAHVKKHPRSETLNATVAGGTAASRSVRVS
jgi:hypothetical protein